MVKQVILSQCGIKFDERALEEAGISTIVPPGPTDSTVEQIQRRMPESEAGTVLPASPGPSGEGGGVATRTWPQDEDVRGAVHDRLKSQPLWWLLEFKPMKFTWQETDGTWKSKWG